MTTNKRTLASRLAGLASFVALSLAATTAQAIFVRTAVNYRPVARAVVGTAAVIGTAAVVGSVVRSLPPSCSTMVVNNVPYQHCGNAYYQPQYSASQVTYVVVNPPQH